MSWQSAVICGVVLDREGSVAAQVVFFFSPQQQFTPDLSKQKQVHWSAFAVQMFAPNKSNSERCRGDNSLDLSTFLGAIA